jgi:type II secretory pathway component PulK
MQPAPSSDGYITLAVLVMAGLLASIVSALFVVAHPALGLARIGADEVAAEALVDAGLNAAGYLLFIADQRPATVNGRTLRFRGGAVRLGVVDESGRIDINAADPNILAGLLEAAGGKSLDPDTFAARVVDWRDADEERSEGGAEQPDYESAELDYGPTNGPFRSAEDLRFIVGLSRDDFTRLRPFITVFTASKSIDPLSAPETVLRAVPDLSAADARRIVEARRAGPSGEDTLATLIAPYAAYLSAGGPRVYRIGIGARLASGFSTQAEAVIMAAADENADFRIVAWSKAAP